MITRIEVYGYKCLKNASINLEPFNILIGPNASGKSTLLDILEFLKDSMLANAEEAVRMRAKSLKDLVWLQKDDSFKVALEVKIPSLEVLPSSMVTMVFTGQDYSQIRYEVSFGLSINEEIEVLEENLWLVTSNKSKTSFIKWGKQKPKGYRLILRKTKNGNNYFQSETTKWNIMFRLAPNRLALSGLPEDERRFPISLWFKRFLSEGIKFMQLNSVKMRKACPPDVSSSFQSDGSNLPKVIQKLIREDRLRFEWWVDHLKTVLEDLSNIKVLERPEDRYLYLVALFNNGLEVPSWMLSDGTLRLMALTLLAYIPSNRHVFLIEEPENGIHPKAIEAVFDALSSVYDGQVFVATHSPVFLTLAEPKHLLCFSKNEDGSTSLLRGSDHPALKDWRRETTLDVLFASGILS